MATKGDKKEILQKTLIHMLKDIPFKMSDLAEELQLSRKTLYNYFSSRNMLIRETARYFFEQKAENIEQIILSDKPYVERGRDLVANFHKTVSEIESLVKKKVLRTDRIEKLSQDTYCNLTKVIEDYIIEGMNANILKQDVRPGRVAEMFFLLLKGDFHYGENYDEDRFIDYSRMIFFGIVEDSHRFPL